MASTARVTYTPEQMQMIPSSYEGQLAYEQQHNQAIAYNTAAVKSKYEELLGLNLTHSDTKKDLSSIMNEANDQLKKITSLDMSIGDNQNKALAVFKPLYDNNNQVAVDIWGDHALTSAVQKNNNLFEEAKIKNNGKDFNKDAYELNNSALLRYSLSDKSSWKNILNNMDGYQSYYDTQAEDNELIKNFQADKIKTKQSMGNGQMITYEDSSVTAKQLKDYLDANHSEKYKEQKGLESKNKLSKIMLASVNPQTKQYDPSYATKYYSNVFEGIKEAKIQDVSTGLAGIQKQIAFIPNTVEGKKLREQLSTVAGQYSQELQDLGKQTFDPSSLSSLSNFERASQTISGLDYELSSIQKARANKHINTTTEESNDETYWARINANLAQHKFDYEQKHDADMLNYNSAKDLAQLELEYYKATGKKLKKDINGNPILDFADNYHPESVGKGTGNVQKSDADMGAESIKGVFAGAVEPLKGLELNLMGIAAAGKGVDSKPVDMKTIFAEMDAKDKNSTWGEAKEFGETKGYNYSFLNDYTKAILTSIQSTPQGKRFKSIDEVPYKYVKEALIKEFQDPTLANHIMKTSTADNKDQLYQSVQQALQKHDAAESMLNQLVDDYPELKGKGITIDDITNPESFTNKLDKQNIGKVIPKGNYKGWTIIDINGNNALITDGFGNMGVSLSELNTQNPFLDTKKISSQFYTKAYQLMQQFNLDEKHDVQNTPSTTSPVYNAEGHIVDEQLDKQWKAHENSIQTDVQTLRSSGNEDKYLELVHDFPRLFIETHGSDGTRFVPNWDVINNPDIVGAGTKDRFFDKANTISGLDNNPGITGWIGDALTRDKINKQSEFEEQTLESGGNALAARSFHLPGRNYEVYKPQTEDLNMLINGGGLNYKTTINGADADFHIKTVGGDITNAKLDVTGSVQAPVVKNGRLMLNSDGQPLLTPIFAQNIMVQNGGASNPETINSIGSHKTAILQKYSQAGIANDIFKKYLPTNTKGQSFISLDDMYQKAVLNQDYPAQEIIKNYQTY